MKPWHPLADNRPRGCQRLFLMGPLRSDRRIIKPGFDLAAYSLSEGAWNAGQYLPRPRCQIHGRQSLFRVGEQPGQESGVGAGFDQHVEMAGRLGTVCFAIGIIPFLTLCSHLLTTAVIVGAPPTSAADHQRIRIRMAVARSDW